MSDPLQLPPPPPQRAASTPASGIRQIVDSVLYLAVYLGLGALTHASLIGPTFNPHDLRSWGMLLAWWWPVFLIAGKWIGIVALGLVAIAAVLGLLYFAYVKIDLWRFRRNLMKDRADSGRGFS